MPPRDDSARYPVRPYAERWAAESPFVGEAAEEQAPIDPWYQGYTPFVEGLEEMYATEAGWESDLAALEAESPFQNAFVEGRTGLIEPEELEEGSVMEEQLPLQGQSLQSLLSSQECQKRLKSTSVAVVGGGLAGLMAARELGQRGIKVTVFEARSQVGGRVLSNRKFSTGRITEEGAELIGSFFTEWLTLAQKYGLAVISRMDDGLYWRACLNVKLTLDQPLTMKEIDDLWNDAKKRVLMPIAQLASQIQHPSEPWLESGKKQCGQKLHEKLHDVQQLDGMSVADALTQCYGVKPTERLWKAMEFLLVNNEVAPLEEMNFLGLLCKVKAGQGARCNADDTPDERLMGYWEELEIFRCADGCQELANKMTEEIRTKYGANIRLNTAVTHIDLSPKGVVLECRQVVDERTGKLADKPLPLPLALRASDYVILAVPPTVWDRVTITALTADGKKEKVNLNQEVGVIGMGDAVKFFSDVKERFWIKENAAPSGGSLKLGHVWEGTDNQTRAGNQGIVLSVYAGPIIHDPMTPGRAPRRVPNPGEFDRELRNLYPGYPRKPKTRFSDWPNVPFIKTGFASPGKGDIFKLGKKLSEPFRDRLFFAGEHTDMAFFGYMEGALRSGKRAANKLMLQSCGLLKKPAPASSEPPVRGVASAAPIRANTASEYESDTPLKEHSSTDYPGEAESLFVGESEEEWEPRAAVLASESPFLNTAEAFEERPVSAIVPEVYEEETNEPEAGGFHEKEDEFETESEGEQQVLHAYEDEPGAVVEPEDTEELYAHVHEQDLDKELVELKETEGLESDEEELGWLTEDSGEEESERDEEESVEAFESAEAHHEVDRFDPSDELDADEQHLSTEPELDALAFEALGSDDEHVSDGGAGLQSEVREPREVRALQESINKWRVENGQTPIKEDGLLRAETNKAVLEFQKASGFKRVHQDGIAGPATAERLTLLLAILKNIPTSPVFTENRRRLLELVGGAGFRSLEGPTQTWVLKRILIYQRSPSTLDNIRHLTNLATQTGFELLPTSSQKLMLRAFAARPRDAQLSDSFVRLAGGSDFRQLNPSMQTDMLNATARAPGNVESLMNLVTTPGFGNLATDVRVQVLDGLPSRFGNVQLNPPNIGNSPPTNTGNMLRLITAPGFEKLRREVRDLMLDIQGNRPDNETLANALRDLAENPKFRHDHRMARQTILRVADSIP